MELHRTMEGEGLTDSGSARRSKRARVGCVLGLMGIVVGLAGCLTRVQKGDRLLQAGKVEPAIAVLEKAVRKDPESLETQLILGSAYFRKAQHSLESENVPGYLEYVERAQGAWLRALELDPESFHVHNQLGILATYRGDLEAARKSFDLGRQLKPGTHEFYLNLAEIYVYRGEVEKAERFLRVARKLGAPTGAVELVEVLATWQRGDLVEAKDIFEGVKVIDPEAVRTWNGGTSIDSFRDMAIHCCRLDFCGPYMEQACRRAEIPMRVKPKTDVEILTESEQLERERLGTVREVYDRRRDLGIRPDSPEGESLRALEIVVDGEPDEASAPDGTPRSAGPQSRDTDSRGAASGGTESGATGVGAPAARP